MSKPVIIWNGAPVEFVPGDTVAVALLRAGIPCFGRHPAAHPVTIFCGIGQCQNCLVALPGCGIREACLLPCSEGLTVFSLKDTINV